MANALSDANVIEGEPDSRIEVAPAHRYLKALVVLLQVTLELTTCRFADRLRRECLYHEVENAQRQRKLKQPRQFSRSARIDIWRLAAQFADLPWGILLRLNSFP